MALRWLLLALAAAPAAAVCGNTEACSCLLNCDLYAGLNHTCDTYEARQATGHVLIEKHSTHLCEVGTCLYHCADICGSDTTGLVQAMTLSGCNITRRL